jgi:hypothetical protein
MPNLRMPPDMVVRSAGVWERRVRLRLNAARIEATWPDSSSLGDLNEAAGAAADGRRGDS